MTIELSGSERDRYSAQIEGRAGVDGQLRLKGARAIVVGAGAAGSAAAAQLASSGVGYVAIVDGAAVSLRDLAGQAIYYTPDVGQSKADTVAGKLGLLNPEVQVDSYPVAFTADNAEAIVEGHDLVLDCSHEEAVRTALETAGVTALRSAPGQAAGAALGDDALGVLTRSPDRALT